MKKKITVILLTIALLVGCGTQSPAISSAADTPDMKTLIQHSVDEAIRERMEGYEEEQRKKDEEIARLKEQLEDLADAGILAQGTYNPTAVMTRGRFCYFMVHLVQRVGRRDLLRQVKPMPADYFDDVASETGYGGRYNVYTAASYGLTEGALVDGRRLADCDSDLPKSQDDFILKKLRPNKETDYVCKNP